MSLDLVSRPPLHYPSAPTVPAASSSLPQRPDQRLPLHYPSAPTVPAASSSLPQRPDSTSGFLPVPLDDLSKRCLKSGRPNGGSETAQEMAPQSGVKMGLAETEDASFRGATDGMCDLATELS
ncbi:hypothetical protein BgiMline_000655 [Biomphalaria glabrata]|nr:hypothetical protein BgiMline_000602 [Biomphalaria glabrata]